jgi:membrane protein
MPVLAERLRRLAAHMWRHFRQDRCFEEAASLSYTSLLSLVPLLAVVFGVASAFPVFDRWAGELQSFVFDNFVPASGAQVEAYLNSFLASVSRLTLPGTFVLIITALLLMMRIEKAFNRIWRVPVDRGFLSRIVMYWAVLTLGPITLGVATALSAQPLLDWLGGETAGARRWYAGWIFVLTWLTFCIVFVLVPNRRVRLWHAAAGAFVSAVLFSAAKTVFVWYVARASFNVLYGTLATIPIFLLWLYLVWLVTLLGASLSASLTTFSDRGGDWRWPWEWEFLLAYRLIGHLWMAQQTGRAVSTEELSEAEQGVSGAALQGLLENFIAADLVAQDQQSNWFLTRDLDHFTALDLYHSGRFHLPLGRQPDLPTAGEWDEAFMQLLGSASPNLDRSLKSLYTEASHG